MTILGVDIGTTGFRWGCSVRMRCLDLIGELAANTRSTHTTDGYTATSSGEVGRRAHREAAH